MKYFRVYRAFSLREKIFGLIGKEEIEPLFIETRWGIHTFGVKHPIDIIILDKNNVVCILKKDLPPNRIFIWNPVYKKIIELPSGTIFLKKIKLGDEVKF